MILDVALGIVLGVVLLVMIPYVIAFLIEYWWIWVWPILLGTLGLAFGGQGGMWMLAFVGLVVGLICKRAKDRENERACKERLDAEMKADAPRWREGGGDPGAWETREHQRRVKQRDMT
jgi:hypothetical protein